MTPPTLADPLTLVGDQPLTDIPPAVVDAVVRRIVDNQALGPKLDVAAFNSAV